MPFGIVMLVKFSQPSNSPLLIYVPPFIVKDVIDDGQSPPTPTGAITVVRRLQSKKAPLSI